jgi:hypothetical protein
VCAVVIVFRQRPGQRSEARIVAGISCASSLRDSPPPRFQPRSSSQASLVMSLTDSHLVLAYC